MRERVGIGKNENEGVGRYDVENRQLRFDHSRDTRDTLFSLSLYEIRQIYH